MEEVGRIIPCLIGTHLRGGDSRLVEILTSLWPRAVGKGIAQHSRPVTFVSGTLTMAASCSSWASQLGQMSEELRAEINSFLGRPVVKKLRVLHVPSLVLENGNSTTEAAKLKMEAGRLKFPNGHLKRALELANLDPETARLVADAFDKYFSRPRTGR
jgi:hypothetical protein